MTLGPRATQNKVVDTVRRRKNVGRPVVLHDKLKSVCRKKKIKSVLQGNLIGPQFPDLKH